MIRKFAVLAIAIVAVGFVVSSAEAGGTSGAKKSSTIRVKNYSDPGDSVLAVLVPNGTAFPTTISQAQSLGAKQIAGGSVVSLPVAPGAGLVAASYVVDIVNPFDPALIGTANYNVTKAGLTGYVGVFPDLGPGDAPAVVTGAAAGGPF
jgi:hypothetical protein